MYGVFIFMPKDPAFLFYTSDFLTGTMFMTDEEVGIYTRLLCAQHQHGGAIPKDFFMAMVKGKNNVISKFVECEDGFYNFRLLQEMGIRTKKSESLSKNSLIRWNKYREKMQKDMQLDMQKDMQLDMPIEDEDEDENKDKDSVFPEKGVRGEKPRENFIVPLFAEVEAYCKKRSNKVNPLKFYNFYESKGWMIGKNKMKNWQAAVRTWEMSTRNQGGVKTTDNPMREGNFSHY